MLVVPSKRKEKIDALMASVVFGFNTAKLDGIQQMKNVTAVVVRTYAPNIPPPQSGWIRLDTTGGKAYIAKGTTSSSDWSVLGNVGGSLVSKKIAVGDASGNITSYTNFGYDSATGIMSASYVDLQQALKVGGTKVVGLQNVSPYTSNPETSAYTGIDRSQPLTPYAKVTDLNSLRLAYEDLRTGFEYLRSSMLNHGLVRETM